MNTKGFNFKWSSRLNGTSFVCTWMKTWIIALYGTHANRYMDNACPVKGIFRIRQCARKLDSSKKSVLLGQKKKKTAKKCARKLLDSKFGTLNYIDFICLGVRETHSGEAYISPKN